VPRCSPACPQPAGIFGRTRGKPTGLSGLAVGKSGERPCLAARPVSPAGNLIALLIEHFCFRGESLLSLSSVCPAPLALLCGCRGPLTRYRLRSRAYFALPVEKSRPRWKMVPFRSELSGRPVVRRSPWFVTLAFSPSELLPPIEGVGGIRDTSRFSERPAGPEWPRRSLRRPNCLALNKNRLGAGSRDSSLERRSVGMTFASRHLNGPLPCSLRPSCEDELLEEHSQCRTPGDRVNPQTCGRRNIWPRTSSRRRSKPLRAEKKPQHDVGA
jgi:hypothetical protein